MGLSLILFRSRSQEAPEKAIEAEAPIRVQQELVPPTVIFTDITTAAGIDFVHFNGATGEKLLPETMGSGVDFFGYDGDLDVALTQAGRSTLLRNDQTTGHRWVRLKLRGKGSNRDVIGARLELPAGGTTQRRQVMPTAAISPSRS